MQNIVLTVSEIVRKSKSILEQNIGPVWIDGEVSNVRAQSSGHLYFSLKDSEAQIKAVCFSYKSKIKTFELVDGLQVLALGVVTIYEKGGSFQINIQKIEPKGLGALQLAYEQLKEKLLKEGLFDPNRKKPIPVFPRSIGVITSPTGAALKDFLNVVTRRFSPIHIIIFPSRVQGKEATAELIQGLDYFNEVKTVDVIVLTRGGGSLEDLWCFNDESIARKIVTSTIPVISAVGHEIDWTICDYVSDLRAPTPSAAAELVVGKAEDFLNTLERYSQQIKSAFIAKVQFLKERIQGIAQHYVLREPANYVRQKAQWLDDQLARLHISMLNILKESQQTLKLSIEKISVLNPLGVLSRGYSLTMDQDGHIIDKVALVKKGDIIKNLLSEGEVISKVQNVLDKSYNTKYIK